MRPESRGAWRAQQIRRARDTVIAAGGAASLAGVGLYNTVRSRSRPAGLARNLAPQRRRINAPRPSQSRRTVVRVDGTSSGAYAMPRKSKRKRKKQKFSARKEIAKLKKNIPKWSSKTFRAFETQQMKSTDPNQHILFDVNVFDKTVLKNYVSNLTLVDSAGTADYSTSNSHVKMNNYFKYMVKNNMTTNCRISYAFFVCIDDDNETPSKSVQEDLTDRGYPSIPNPVGPTGATATSSVIPKRLVLGAGTVPYHVPVLSGAALSKNWKIQGPVKTANIGPGDTTAFIWSRNNFVYKQEVLDQEASFAHLKDYSVRLLVSIHGDLAHDNTNPLLVGRGNFNLDCEYQRQSTVKYFNPKGLKEVDYQDTLTNAGFTNPVHADNKQSAIENDQFQL